MKALSLFFFLTTVPLACGPHSIGGVYYAEECEEVICNTDSHNRFERDVRRHTCRWFNVDYAGFEDVLMSIEWNKPLGGCYFLAEVRITPYYPRGEE